jgi:hypothetical protein
VLVGTYQDSERRVPVRIRPRRAISPIMKDQDDDTYTDDEAERRAREAIRRSFDTPYKPQREMIGKAGRAKRQPSKDAKKSK